LVELQDDVDVPLEGARSQLGNLSESKRTRLETLRKGGPSCWTTPATPQS
jgi:hypothetical protein